MDFGGYNLVHSALLAHSTHSNMCCKLLALISPSSPLITVLGILGVLDVGELVQSEPREAPALEPWWG